MNLYNVMVYYEGEGNTNIYIPGLGDTTIYQARPLYLKNVSFNVIEALRQFRNMQVNIKIGHNGLGAFRTIDLGVSRSSNTSRVPVAKEEPSTISNSDIASVLKSATSGPIPLEPVKSTTVDYGSYTLPSGQFEGKTLTEVDKLGKLKSVYNGFKTRNPEVKEAIEKYYESQIK